MTNTPTDFEQIAITRDLIRKPETRFLASVLESIATSSVAKTSEPKPIYVTLAHKIINHPGAMSTLQHALEVVKK
jgi:hypothetical protein